MTIYDDFTELKSLDTELKTLRKQLKTLQNQKTTCEQRIIEYLDANDLPGAKYNNTAIMIAQKVKRSHQKKSDKITNGADVLRRHGVSDPNSALDELMTAMRGQADTIPILKIL